MDIQIAACSKFPITALLCGRCQRPFRDEGERQIRQARRHCQFDDTLQDQMSVQNGSDLGGLAWRAFPQRRPKLSFPVPRQLSLTLRTFHRILQ